MTLRRTRTRLPLALVSLAAASALVVGCSPGGTTTDDDGGAGDSQGVPYGASIAEYQAAFEDVDPIRLTVQVDGAEGAWANRAMTMYADAVGEWSGGKITFEVGWSRSLVPSAIEWSTGLADGRLDIGDVLPYYNPDLFPELSALAAAQFLDGNLPASPLITSAWMTETLYGDEQYRQEAEDVGIHVLLAAPEVSFAGIFCSDERTSLDDFDGISVSASGQARIAQLQALGAAPQSISFTELYEALERRIVGCGSTTVTAIDSIGAQELVPFTVVDPEAALTGFPLFLAVGQEQWDDLPLVAQQLLFDRLDVYLGNETWTQAERVVEWLEGARSAGGGILAFDEDARAAVLEANDALLDEMRERGLAVDDWLETQARWADEIAGLYPDLNQDLDEFYSTGAYSGADVDFQPFVELVYTEILLEHRPG